MFGRLEQRPTAFVWPRREFGLPHFLLSRALVLHTFDTILACQCWHRAATAGILGCLLGSEENYA